MFDLTDNAKASMMRFAQFLRRLIDPVDANRLNRRAVCAAFDARPLYISRLEERRVLAADLDSAMPGAASAPFDDGASTLAVPTVTMPANQSTTEGAYLVFSPAAGREIRIDAPGLGAGPLVVQITAFEAHGQVAPSLSFGSTAGVIVTGNGVNVFQLQGSLPSINAALSHVTFHAVDDGDFTISITAIDPATGDHGSGSVAVQVTNIAPQLVFSADKYNEGSFIDIPVYVSDAGLLDNPQVNWSVTFNSVAVASGSGTPVQFFAGSDGVYSLNVTATDKDGGVTHRTEQISVRNIPPRLELVGVMRSGAVSLTVSIIDPGQEHFTVQVAWSTAVSTSEVFFTDSRTLTLDHRYTPEELNLKGEDLTIIVVVQDDTSLASQSLVFREGELPLAERPGFEPLPEPLPLDRLPATQQQPGGTTPQLASPDLAEAMAPRIQAAAELHQFVLRVVGPDGNESESYPLSPEALANLPAFLNNLDVPDGHYRVYLVAGDLERLVIDGHLRDGRIVDPADESQLAFDSSPSAEAAAQAASEPADPVQLVMAPAINDGDRHNSAPGVTTSTDESSQHTREPVAASVGVVTAESAAPVAVPALPPPPSMIVSIATSGAVSTASAGDHAVDSHLAAGISASAFVVVAAAAATTQSLRVRKRDSTKQDQSSHRFTKTARLARKLSRSHLALARP